MSKVKQKQRDFSERLASAVLRILKRCGVGIELYFTVREGDQAARVETPASLLWTGFLHRNEAQQIAAVKHGGSLAQTLRWFDEGKLCFGVKDGSRIVGKMWCDLEAFHFPPEFRRLQTDEAYFFAAAVADEYRGQNLAPLMRTALIDALRTKGRQRFYSYTEYFNGPARRFKEKLGCRNQTLRLHVNLFGKWKRTWTLKRYA